MKSLIPVVMAGILGIYGMIVAVIISQKGMPICNSSEKGHVQLLPRLFSYGFGIGLWLQLHSKKCLYIVCWLFHRKGWGDRYPWECTITTAVRRYDSHSDLWRGTRTLWSYRIFDFGQLMNLRVEILIAMINSEIGDLTGYRLDGRKYNELRGTVIQLGQEKGASGSCYLKQGLTEVLCIVNGPIEVHNNSMLRRKQQIDQVTKMSCLRSATLLLRLVLCRGVSTQNSTSEPSVKT